MSKITVQAGAEYGAYVRLSEGDDLGRQEQDTTEFVARLGGTVARVYREEDTSAFKQRRVKHADEEGRAFYVYRVIRPEFQQMLADLRSGAIQGAVVYDLDRLARDPRDLEDCIEVVEHYKRPIVGTTGGIDLLTDNGRAMARVLVAMANKASADTARRVKRKHRENAERGIPVGGTRPFGWQDDKRSLHPEEAARLRQAVADVIAGKPLASVTVEWQQAGLMTTYGNEWTRTSLLKSLTNPRMAGYSARNVTTTQDGKQVTRREIVRQQDGSPVIGVWEPIITPEEWEQVCAVLATKKPRPGTGGTVTKYLLSGIARCGKCGKPLRGIPRSRVKTEDTYAYLCQGKASGGCGGVSRDGREMDKYVTAALLAKMRQEFEAASEFVEVAPWPGTEQLAEARESVATLAAALGAGRATAALIDALEAQEGRVKRLEKERAEYLAAKAEAEAVPVTMTREEFDALPFPTRRKYVEDRLAAVVVRPMPEAEKRKGKFLPDLLEPAWR